MLPQGRTLGERICTYSHNVISSYRYGDFLSLFGAESRIRLLGRTTVEGYDLSNVRRRCKGEVPMEENDQHGSGCAVLPESGPSGGCAADALRGRRTRAGQLLRRWVTLLTGKAVLEEHERRQLMLKDALKALQRVQDESLRRRQ